MQRILLVLLLVAVFMTGCGKPKFMSQKMYDLGKKALEVCNQYIDDDISLETGYDRMLEISMDADDALFDLDGDDLVRYFDKDSAVRDAITQLRKDFDTGDDIKKDAKVLEKALK